MMSDKSAEGEQQLHTEQIAGTVGTEEQPVARKPEDSPRAEATPLFAGNDAEKFRARWGSIQSGFVDEPQRAVEQADALVAEVMQRLAQVFADERSQLEHQWAGGGDTDTEKLRVALRRYRSFFDRLLAM